MVPGESFPSGAIPSAFLGSVKVELSGQNENAGENPVTLPISLESPFLNPFGNAIIIASTDSPNSILIVTTYQEAKVTYEDAQASSETPGGTLSGTLDQTPVSTGSVTLTTRAVEDLFAGTETESGTVTFSGMTPSILDASGRYSGSSIIPGSSTNPCETTYGFPCTFDCTTFLPLFLGDLSLDLSKLPSTGACTITGFISSGSFTMSTGDNDQGQGNNQDNHVSIKGNYMTVWDIPSVTFGLEIPIAMGGGSTITATVGSE
jgi:hypothetical protein